MVGPLFLSSRSKRGGTHGTRPRQQPPSAWQAIFGPNQPGIPVLAKLSSALSDLEWLIWVLLGSGRVSNAFSIGFPFPKFFIRNFLSKFPKSEEGGALQRARGIPKEENHYFRGANHWVTPNDLRPTWWLLRAAQGHHEQVKALSRGFRWPVALQCSIFIGLL
jgi:hypothetical protein